MDNAGAVILTPPQPPTYSELRAAWASYNEDRRQSYITMSDDTCAALGGVPDPE